MRQLDLLWSFMPLLKIGLCPTLTKDVYESLRNVGLKNVTDFVAADLEDVAKKSGVSYKVKLYFAFGLFMCQLGSARLILAVGGVRENLGCDQGEGDIFFRP